MKKSPVNPQEKVKTSLITSDKPRRGRPWPAKYNVNKCQELIELMAKGYTNAQVFREWNIHKDTFYDWINKHPQFREAYKAGLDRWEAWLMDQFQAMIKGDITAKHAFNSVAMLANNKLNWKNKQEEGTTNNINIGNINVLQTQSAEKLLELISQTNDVLSSHKNVPIEIIDVEEVDARAISQDEPGRTSEISSRDGSSGSSSEIS